MNRERTVKHVGFTLLELILVLGIMVTFASLALPRYSDAVFRHQADLAARRVVADLRQAQSYAKITSASCDVSFSTGTEEYELSGVASFDGAPDDYKVNLSDDPYEAKLVSADFDGGNSVEFDGWGVPNRGGTVVLTVGTEQRTIILDGETGQITIQ